MSIQMTTRIVATCFTCLACFVVFPSVSAQGLINWNNTASTLISVYAGPGTSPMGPMPVRVSPETTYYLGLYVAPLGTPAPSWEHDPNWQFAPAAYATNATTAAGRMQ